MNTWALLRHSSSPPEVFSHLCSYNHKRPNSTKPLQFILSMRAGVIGKSRYLDMAEVIGLISGIAAIVATAFNIAKRISTIADELGTAGQQIMAIAIDIKAMAFVLRQLNKRISAALGSASRIFDPEAVQAIQDFVALSGSEVDRIRAHLMPILATSAAKGKQMGLLQRAKWLFAKSKVSTTRVSLDSLKLTLGLLLDTLDFKEGDHDEYVTCETGSTNL